MGRLDLPDRWRDEDDIPQDLIDVLQAAPIVTERQIDRLVHHNGDTSFPRHVMAPLRQAMRRVARRRNP